jgi:hypothetical protein
MRSIPRKNQKGSQIADFAAALFLLVFVVFVPLIDLTIVPVRWMLAKEIVSNYARKLAACESLTQAYEVMNADPSLETRLLHLGGVSLESVDMHLRVTRVFLYSDHEEFFLVKEPGELPAEWKPNGRKAPCIYALEIEVKSKISPAILLPKGGAVIPGLNAPIPITLTATANWENMGRNPVTKEYYLNE